MKTIYKLLGLFIISSFMILSACEEEYDYTYTGEAFVHFEESSYTATESQLSTIQISILLADVTPTSDVTVNFEVTATAQGVTQTCVQGEDFDIVEPATGNTVTIPAGSNSTYIELLFHDNTVSDSTKYVTFTVTGSSEDVVLGLPGSKIKKSVTVTIQDDDCPFVAENWIGTPSGIETYSNWPTFSAAATWAIEEVISPVKVKYLVTGLMDGIFTEWGETITNGGEYYITLDYTNPLDPQVVLEAKVASPEGFDNYGYYATTDDTWSYYILQDPLYPSTFSTCGRTLTINYVVDISTNGGALDHNFRSCLYEVTFE